jgi:uncharacterized protein (DUF1501 family)
MNRRSFLERAAVIGCSLAASPLVTPVSLAAVPGETRLVVILLRGAMDGLGAVPVPGDPDWTALRGAPPAGEAAFVGLDGRFALHPALAPLAPLWSRGQLGVVHAVSTPYRGKRSHFDGQDILEAGIANLSDGRSRDGWLNRMLGHVPGAEAETAYAVGNDSLPILSGDAPAMRWTPDADLALSPQAIRLAHMVMQDDPAMSRALADAFALADSDGDPVETMGGRRAVVGRMAASMRAARSAAPQMRIAEFVGRRLRDDTRVAAFSLNGWDTHDDQARGLTRALDGLAGTILALRDEMGGPAWKHTVVAVVTEFGRTARMNGNGGTDHGTGGAMILAGGALRGGRVVADWPGLSESALYERRDLLPTRDVRAHLGWLVRGLFGLSAEAVTREVFPGVDLDADPGLLL